MNLNIKWFDEELEGYLVAERLRGRKVDSFGVNCYGYRVKSSIVLGDMIEVFPKGISFVVGDRTEAEIAIAHFKKIDGVNAEWRCVGRDEDFKIEIKAEPNMILKLIRTFEEHLLCIKFDIDTEVHKELEWHMKQVTERLKNKGWLDSEGRLV